MVRHSLNTIACRAGLYLLFVCSVCVLCSVFSQADAVHSKAEKELLEVQQIRVRTFKGLLILGVFHF